MVTRLLVIYLLVSIYWESIRAASDYIYVYMALHSSGKTKFKGVGLGLGFAIVLGIIQAHGGRVWVDSPGYDEKCNPGSQFHIVLPFTLENKEVP